MRGGLERVVDGCWGFEREGHDQWMGTGYWWIQGFRLHRRCYDMTLDGGAVLMFKSQRSMAGNVNGRENYKTQEG